MAQLIDVSSLISKPVSITTAGNDQVAICDPIVYLQASVVGDLSFHTTEWEQISGTPNMSLLIDSPTQAHYVTSVPPGTDKVFRFWVDRGTVFQQYKDVHIRTTPFSNAELFEIGTLSVDVDAPSYTKVNYGSVYGTTAFNYSVPGSCSAVFEQTQVSLNIPDPEWRYTALTTDSQEYAARYAGVRVELWSGTTWVVAQDFLPYANGQLSLVMPYRIRFGSIYRKPGSPDRVVYTNWRDSPSGLIAAHETVPMFELGTLGNQVTVSRIVYQLQMQTYDENVATFEIGTLGNPVTLSRIVYLLDLQTYSDDVTVFEIGNLTNIFKVTRVAGGNLGG